MRATLLVRAITSHCRFDLALFTRPGMTSLTFWKPGTTGPGSSLDRATENEGNVIQSAPIYASSIHNQRERLPIYKHRKKLLYCVEKYGVVIVV